MFYYPIEKPKFTDHTWQGLVDYTQSLLTERKEMAMDRQAIEDFCK